MLRYLLEEEGIEKEKERSVNCVNVVNKIEKMERGLDGREG